MCQAQGQIPDRSRHKRPFCRRASLTFGHDRINTQLLARSPGLKIIPLFSHQAFHADGFRTATASVAQTPITYTTLRTCADSGVDETR